jgi:hypothetical protein
MQMESITRKIRQMEQRIQRARRWAENGVLQRVFEDLHAIGVIPFEITSLKFDSKSIKVHPDAHGAQKKEENSLQGKVKAAGTQKYTHWSLMTNIRFCFP